MADLFWFSDEQWAVIGPFMPHNQPGAVREDDRRIANGIAHVLRSGCRSADRPAEYAPPATVCNRFDRCLGAASGAPRRRRWPKPNGSPNWPHSTAPTCARTARRTAGKGGQDAATGPSRGRRDRWRIEAARCRLKDFRRVGTRYDKLAANFASAVALAAVVAFWR